MFEKASNMAFEPYPVRMTTEALVLELPVESSYWSVHYFKGSTDYCTSTLFDIMNKLGDTRGDKYPVDVID